MMWFGPFELLLGGVLVIYLSRRAGRWMHRRGWIGWNPRGSSSALGNAVLSVHAIYQPQVGEVLEERLRAPDEERQAGDPPVPGSHPGSQ